MLNTHGSDITLMSQGRGTAFRFAWPKPLRLT
jgi:hypothetical protein